jgi:hypothetical protein
MIKAVIEKTRQGLICHRVGGYVTVMYPSHFRLSSSALRVFELRPFEIFSFSLDSNIISAYDASGIQLKTWDKQEVLEIL